MTDPTPKPLPSADVLHERLEYDPDSGDLRWRYRADAIKMWNTRYAGKLAGTQGRDGYVYVAIDTADYLAHRLIHKMMTGQDPDEEVDHENGRRSDNRWSNLRPANSCQNRRNMRPKVRDSGLPKGVYFNKARQKFVAQIKVKREVKYLGLYDTPEAAHYAYVEASLIHHREFGRVA